MIAVTIVARMPAVTPGTSASLERLVARPGRLRHVCRVGAISLVEPLLPSTVVVCHAVPPLLRRRRLPTIRE